MRALTAFFTLMVLLAVSRAASSEHAEAKYWFLRAYLTSTHDTDEMFDWLDYAYTATMFSDPVATAELNSVFKKTLDVVSRDSDPVWQYNIGMFYADVGEPSKAVDWLKRAAAKGSGEARSELQQLNLTNRPRKELSAPTTLSPREPRKFVESKYYFIRSFLLGIRSVGGVPATAPQQKLSELDQLRARVLQSEPGPSLAAAIELNKQVQEVINIIGTKGVAWGCPLG